MILKEFKKGIFTLVHEVYIDDFGFKRSALEIIKDRTKEDMVLRHYPITEMIKVRKSNNFLDTTSKYTKKDYEKMLNEGVSKLKLYYGI